MARDPRERRSAERAPGREERAPPRQSGEPPRDQQGDGPQDLASLFAGGSPREVLGRLLDGDPLDIASHTRERLKQSALLLDIERWTLRSMARVAYAARRWDGSIELARWIGEQVDRAAADLLDEDRAELRLRAEPAEAESRYAFLTKALGIEPRIALRACVAFNDLPPQVRRTFWALVVDGKSYARCASEGLGSHEQVHDNMRRALSTLSQLADPDALQESGEQDA